MKNKLIVMFLILIFNPFVVEAASITINCDTDTVKDNDLTCTIEGKTTEIISGLSLVIEPGNNITFTNFITASTWQGTGEEGKVELYTDKDIEGKFLIGTVNFSINQIKEGYDSKINLNNIDFYDELGIEVPVDAISKKIRIASTDNDLSNLSLNNGSLNPAFNSNTITYSTTINEENVVISASAHNKNAKISGNTGKNKLDYGNNNFKINVTSESGSTKTYTINIIRPDNRTPSNDDDNNDDKITEQKEIVEENIILEKSVSTSNKNQKFNDKKTKNIFITIITVLLIINAIRMIISGIKMKKHSKT